MDSADENETVTLNGLSQANDTYFPSNLDGQYWDHLIVGQMTGFNPLYGSTSEKTKGPSEGEFRSDHGYAASHMNGNEDHNPNELDGSSVNNGLGLGSNTSSPTSAFTYNSDHNQMFLGVNDRRSAQQQQQQQEIIVAPQVAPRLAINTTTARPQHLRRSSNLRNEYVPSAEFGTSMAGPPSHQVFTSSPARYSLHPQSGSRSGATPPQLLQPFQESNLRSSFQQLPSYNSFNQVSRYQQSMYPDPQPLSQNPFDFSTFPGQSRQLMHHYNSSTPRFRDFPMAPPSTPPSYHAPHMGNSESTSSYGDLSPNAVKQEHSPEESPSFPATRKSRKRRNVAQSALVSYPRTDEDYIEELVEAMIDMSQAEDNVGMKTTWTKILQKKQDQLRPVCAEMLDLLKRASREQLGDKKPCNTYTNFDHRFSEFCDAARTQKTIGKHLMESPYAHVVANDPTYAASRVRNNRRVNGQKREAITLGRRAMGLSQGKGKGHRLRKLSDITAADLDDDWGDQDDDFVADSDESGDDDSFKMDNYPRRKNSKVKSEPSSIRKSTRNSTKKPTAINLEDSPVAKKQKRKSRSKHQDSGKGRMIKPTDGADSNNMANTPRAFDQDLGHHDQRSSSTYLPSMGSSPIQESDADQYSNTNVFGHSPYGHSAQILAALSPDSSGSFYQQPSQFNQHFSRYSSRTDPNSLDNANQDSNNKNSFAFAANHLNAFH